MAFYSKWHGLGLLLVIAVFGMMTAERDIQLRQRPEATSNVVTPKLCTDTYLLSLIESKRDFDEFVAGRAVTSPERDHLDCAVSGPRYLQPSEKTTRFQFSDRLSPYPKVYDTFIVSTEMHAMLLRMETLQDIVDFFVFVDSNETYTGQTKPLHFHENAQKFHKFKGRILYRTIQFPEHTGKGLWDREGYSRDQAVALALNHSTNDADIIMHSDVDEIPSPFVVRLLKQCEIRHADSKKTWGEAGEGVVMRQERVHGDLGCYTRNYQPWFGTRVETAANVRKHAPTYGKLMRKELGAHHVLRAWDGGWHISNVPFGDSTMLRTKFATFAHTNDASQQRYKRFSDGEWARQVVDGFPGGDYVCTRKGRKEMTAPTAAFVYINEFGPFMSPEQRALANYIYLSTCVL